MKALEGELGPAQRVMEGKMRWVLRCVTTGALALAALASCQMLAGLEDRRTGSGAAAGQGGAAGNQGAEEPSGASGQSQEVGGGSGSGGQTSGGRVSSGGQAIGGSANEPEGGQGGADGDVNRGGRGATGEKVEGGTEPGATTSSAGATATGRSATGGGETGGASNGGEATGAADTGVAAGLSIGGTASGGIEAGGASTGGNATGGADRVGSTPKPVGATCQDTAQCVAGAVCTLGLCRQSCSTDADCPRGSLCSGARAPFGCSLSSEEQCESEDDCPAPLLCAVDHKCRIGCTRPADCPRNDQSCRTGACVSTFDSDPRWSECEDGETACSAHVAEDLVCPAPYAPECRSIMGCRVEGMEWGVVEICEQACWQTSGLHGKLSAECVAVAYPAIGEHGSNLLDLDTSAYGSGPFSLAAEVPPGTTLRVELAVDSGEILGGNAMDRGGWDFRNTDAYPLGAGSVGEYVALEASVDSILVVVGPGSGTVLYYENGATEPTRTKPISWD